MPESFDSPNEGKVVTKEKTARDIMTSPALSDPIDRVLEVMLSEEIKHVPVLDEGGRPVGMIARHDLLKMLASERGLVSR